MGRALKQVSGVWVLFLGCTHLSEPVRLFLRYMRFTVCNLHDRKRKKAGKGKIKRGRVTELSPSSLDILVRLSQWFIFHVSGYPEVLSLDIFLKHFPVILLFCEGKRKKSVLYGSLYQNTLLITPPTLSL